MFSQYYGNYLLNSNKEVVQATLKTNKDGKIDDVDLAKSLLDDEDDDTESLAQELEEQKKKLEEINTMMNENEKATKTKTKKKKEEVEEDLEDSELFDLIDSMYEKKDDE